MKVDWTDSDGIKRRSYIPDAMSDTPPQEGIPVDVYDILDESLGHVSDFFRMMFYHELWIRGMVEQSDFAKRDALRNVRQALQIALTKSASDIIRLITGVNDE